MPKFTIQQSQIIDAPIQKVFEIITDLNQWSRWSPWIITEPETKTSVSLNNKNEGAEYTWEGTRTGTGKITHTHIEAPTRVEQEVTFVRPYKSTAKVWFALAENKEKTTVTWNMEGSLPFFLFFMKRSMEAWISMDYMRGLLMLKDYVETGTVASKVNLKGIQDLPHLNYIGKETQCTIDEIGPAMDKDFDALKNLLKEKKIQPTSKPLCIYVDYDLIKKNVHYIAAIPVEKHNHTIPDIFMNGMIPETKAYEVQHIGSYTHLGNAWSTGYSLMQNNVFKKNKQLAPFEVYANDPATIAPGELITKIYFPVK